MSLLDPNHRSPLDPPVPKSKEQRQEEALQEAMEADRKNLTDPSQVRLTALEARMAQVEAAATLMATMRGDFPMKVTDNIVSIDPSVANKLQNLGTVTRNVCVNGSPGVEVIYGFPATPL